MTVKVLIVDDSKAMQSIITKAMKAIGHNEAEYRYAADGESGLNAIREQRPDVVLCDMHMPGSDGLHLVTGLRASGDRTPVIVVSIDAEEATVTSAKAAGADAFLKKPFTSEQLYEVVSPLIEQSAAAGPASRDTLRQHAPEPRVLARLLSSLAETDVTVSEVTYQVVDYTQGPFYGGTFQDENGRLAATLFMDGLAANMLGAIIAREPLQNAVKAAQQKTLSDATRQSLFAFLGIYSAVFRPPRGKPLLDVIAEQYAEDPGRHLQPRIDKFAECVVVYAVHCGREPGGKIMTFMVDPG